MISSPDSRTELGPIYRTNFWYQWVQKLMHTFLSETSFLPGWAYHRNLASNFLGSDQKTIANPSIWSIFLVFFHLSIKPSKTFKQLHSNLWGLFCSVGNLEIWQKSLKIWLTIWPILSKNQTKIWPKPEKNLTIIHKTPVRLTHRYPKDGNIFCDQKSHHMPPTYPVHTLSSDRRAIRDVQKRTKPTFFGDKHKITYPTLPFPTVPYHQPLPSDRRTVQDIHKRTWTTSICDRNTARSWASTYPTLVFLIVGGGL